MAISHSNVYQDRYSIWFTKTYVIHRLNCLDYVSFVFFIDSINKNLKDCALLFLILLELIIF